jgi:hypothetical protein
VIILDVFNAIEVNDGGFSNSVEVWERLELFLDSFERGGHGFLSSAVLKNHSGVVYIAFEADYITRVYCFSSSYRYLCFHNIVSKSLNLFTLQISERLLCGGIAKYREIENF